jgi:hypothetical protein
MNWWGKWRSDPAKRALVSQALQSLTQKVVSQDKDLETLQAEDAHTVVMQGGLPVTWQDPDGNTLRGRNAQIASLDGQAIGTFARAPTATCAECKYFNLKQGREALVKQRFAERLVLEEEWKLRHLGGEIDHMGVCAAGDGNMATFTMSPACGQFSKR